MPDGHSLLNQQLEDYQSLLESTRTTLEGDLDPSDVSAYLALREQVQARTAPRDAPLAQALAGAGDALLESVARYREVLETIIALEGDLAKRAKAECADLSGRMAGLTHGRRALSGYRPVSGSGDPSAISHRV